MLLNKEVIYLMWIFKKENMTFDVIIWYWDWKFIEQVDI